MVQLLQALVRAHPTYTNPKGIEAASELILEALSKCDGCSVTRLAYTNRAIMEHPSYVPVETFGDSFAGDRDAAKVGVVAVNSVDPEQVGQTIILNGHYDVDGVYDATLWTGREGWRSGEEAGLRIYGRGATDMLGGLCCLIYTFKLLCACAPAHLRIILSIVPDEELGGNGSIYQLEWLKSNFAIHPDTSTVLIAEPTDKTVCLESLGFFPFRMTWSEPTHHAGCAASPNAILRDIAQVAKELEELVDATLSTLLPSVRQPVARCTIGELYGGKDPAIPLSDLNLGGVIFLPVDIDASAFRDAFARVLAAELSAQPRLSWSELTFHGHVTPKADLADRLTGDGVKRGVFPSPCDARVFAAAGFPVVIYGPGALQQAHATNEYVELEELLRYLTHLTLVLIGDIP